MQTDVYQTVKNYSVNDNTSNNSIYEFPESLNTFDKLSKSYRCEIWKDIIPSSCSTESSFPLILKVVPVCALNCYKKVKNN